MSPDVSNTQKVEPSRIVSTGPCSPGGGPSNPPRPRCRTPPRTPAVADPRELLAVCLGGVAGAVLRTAVAGWLPHSADAWPWATFLVNLAGAFVLGVAVTAIHERRAFLRRLLATGFCGALTTFSTMQLEVLRMLDANDLPLAAGYLAASVALGLACVVAGSGLTRRWR